MIARDAEPQALQLPTSFVDFQTTSFGDELPTVTCDLVDLNIPSNEFDQILQNLKDMPLSLDNLSMDYEGLTNQNQENVLAFFAPVAAANTATLPFSQLTNVFMDESDTKTAMICESVGNVDNSAAITAKLEPNLLSFFQSLSNAASVPISSGASSAGSQGDGCATPPFSGGSTPQSQSRAPSPAWSEGSGNMSTSSVSGLSCPRKMSGGGESNPLPRHKRPSHKRAEVKRRDKIKTTLDEIKSNVPSLQDKGKLSESAILFKAAEYIHQLKDGVSDRGNKAAELRREIQSLSEEIHSFQETLPAGGLKQEESSLPCLDQLYSDWVAKQNKISTKHYIFHSITYSLFDSFKKLMGDASTLDSVACRLQEWQTRCLSLPVLRKPGAEMSLTVSIVNSAVKNKEAEILQGMLKLTRESSVVTFPKDLNLGSSVDGNS